MAINSILHISDTHNQHRKLTNLPDADVIVHSGDFCFAGTEEEAFDFINWFCDLPYKHKIFIAGNHDECLYGADNIEGLDDNCHYLCNSDVVIEGVKFYDAAEKVSIPPPYMILSADIQFGVSALFSFRNPLCFILVEYLTPFICSYR